MHYLKIIDRTCIKYSLVGRTLAGKGEFLGSTPG